MKKYKRIYVLMGILLLVGVLTISVNAIQHKKEEIKNSKETIIQVPVESITEISWEQKDVSQPFAFQKDEEWIYDADETFPVDEEKLENVLSMFEDFQSVFKIENVEDYNQYGLEDPVATIRFKDENKEYEILIGDYSAMDLQRYVSINDGNVYLVETDPLDRLFDELKDVIKNDEVPDLTRATVLSFSGRENYEIHFEEESLSYRKDDTWFTNLEGEEIPLDPKKVEDYLNTLSFLKFSEYVTYDATEEELSDCGLDKPELTVEVEYLEEIPLDSEVKTEEKSETSKRFVLHLSRDPKEVAEAKKKSEKSGEMEEDDEITMYAQVGNSPIIYKVINESYKELYAISYNELRHDNIIPANTDDIVRMEFVLEGKNYDITSKNRNEERTWYLKDEEIDVADLKTELATLKAMNFTEEKAEGKEEIAFTITLEGSKKIEVRLLRYDGTSCLAEIDGETAALVNREEVINLIEALNAIVLD